MKSIILSLSVLLLASIGAFAQIEISPGTLVLEGEGVDSIYVELAIKNNNSDPVNIHWIYEPAANYPSNWKTQICDIELCYFFDNFNSNPNIPNLIEAGQEVIFKFTVKNIIQSFPVSGSSYGILRLFDDPDKTNEVASTSPVTSTVDLSYDDLVIYPNPTTASFQLKNDVSVSRISIYDITGKHVNTFDHSKGMLHDVSAFRTGIYSIILEDNDGDMIKSIRLDKR